MQFFYIDYMNGNKKERNIGFLRPDKEGLHVGLHGVPTQCGSACSVYVLNHNGEKRLLGRVPVKNGYGMQKFGWTREIGFEDCVSVEIPLYGARVGRCMIREAEASRIERTLWSEEELRSNETLRPNETLGANETLRPNETLWLNETLQREQTPQREEPSQMEETLWMKKASQKEETLWMKEASQMQKIPQSEQTSRSDPTSVYNVQADDRDGYRGSIEEEIVAESIPDKWSQLLHTYPQVHILPEAQSILIKPRDIIILTEKYHELATNSFVLHAYYNYRQLLLFNYIQGETGDAAYYIGVPGVYYERECRIAQMFGFEGFENGEVRMREEGERENALHKGCFGYYMKQVEI